MSAEGSPPTLTSTVTAPVPIAVFAPRCSCISPSSGNLELAENGGHHVVEGPAIGFLAYGLHLPAAAGPADLGHDLSGMGARAGQIVAGHFLAVAGVDEPAIGILDLVERVAGEAVHGEDEVGDMPGDRREIDDDLLVVAVALAGPVVPGVDDAAVIASKLLEPDRVEHLALRIEEQAGRVEVDVAAAAAEHAHEALRLADVPAEPHRHPGQSASARFFKAYALALRKTHHVGCPLLGWPDAKAAERSSATAFSADPTTISPATAAQCPAWAGASGAFPAAAEPSPPAAVSRIG